MDRSDSIYKLKTHRKHLDTQTRTTLSKQVYRSLVLQEDTCASASSMVSILVPLGSQL